MTDFVARRGLLLAVFAAILGADRITKILAERGLAMGDPVTVIPGFFQLTLVHNTGVAFGLLNNTEVAGMPWILIGVSAALVALFVWIAFRYGPLSTLSALGISAIVAGAIGNIADRVIYGYVVDFLDFHVGTAHWPTFNIADAMICTGLGLFLLDSVRDLRRSSSPGADAEPAGHQS